MKNKSKKKKLDKNFTKIKSKINKSKSSKQALYNFKTTFSLDIISQYFSNVISLPLFNNTKIKNLIFDREEEFYNNYFYHNPKDIWHELSWTALTLNYYKSSLKDYYELKVKFENSILLSDFNKAEDLLNSIEKKFGKSLWIIKNRLNILQETQGLEAQKEYSKMLEKKDININSKILIYLYSISAEKNISLSYFNRIIDNFFEGFTDKARLEYIKFKLKKDHQVDLKYFTHILMEESNTSLIDLYETFIDITNNIICMNLEIKYDAKIFIKILRKLCTNTNDYRIVNALRTLGINIKPTTAEKEVSIINIYNNILSENYDEVANSCKEILSLNPTYISLYEPYIESIYNLKEEIHFNKDSLIYSILDNYKNMLLINEKTHDSILNLLKMSVTYSNLSFVDEILSFVLNYIKDEKSYKTNIGYLNTPIFSLLKHEIYPDIIKNTYITEMKNTTSSSSLSITILSMFDEDENTFKTTIETNNFSKDYRNNLLTQYYYLNKEYNLCYQYALKLDESNNIFTKNQAKSYILMALIEEKTYIDVLKKAIEFYFDNNNISPILPIVEIIDKIIDSIKISKKWPNDIETVILFYLCTITRHHDTQSRLEYLYEHYLISNNYKRPMALIRNYEKANQNFDKKIIYFLKEICIPDIMKKSIYFSDFNDVEKERIQICHALKIYDYNNENTYLQEIREREQNLFVRKESSRIEKNKIYVDIESIKKIYEKELKDDYERLLKFFKENNFKKDNELVEFIEHIKTIPIEEKISDREALGAIYLPDIPTNEVDNLFKKIIDIARDIFVKNEHYGLDVYLSTKIRHGTISNHLRKPLEKENLITLKDARTGQYQNNQYWEDEFFRFSESNLTALQFSLKNFSKRHDEIIKYLSAELLQINTSLVRQDIEGKIIENENKDALFKYYFSDLELKDMLYEILDKQLSFNEVINYILQILWEKTDINLNNIRNKLEQDIKQEIQNNFDELIENLDKINEDTNPLINAIAKARTEMNQSFKSLVAWFGRMEDSEKSDYEIQNVIEIVESIFKKSADCFEINININSKLKGKTLDSLVDVFFILFDNAFKHSNKGDDTEIIIDILTQDDLLVINILNNISTNESIEQLNTNIQPLKESYGTEEATSTIHKEGNTGFNKIWKIISKDLLIEPSEEPKKFYRFQII